MIVATAITRDIFSNFTRMRRYFTFLVFIVISSATYCQDYKKQIEGLDTAYAQGDYPLAKKIINKIYPTAATVIKDDTVLVEFLKTTHW